MSKHPTDNEGESPPEHIKAYRVHLYIVVDCKTRNCRSAHVLRYLGEKGSTAASVEYWMSYPLLIACPTCGETYDYSDAEERFRQKELPLPPPPDYVDRLAWPTLPTQTSKL